MHDLDRTFMEQEEEGQAFEFSSGEQQEQWNEVFQEQELQALAGELLSIQSEEELNYFLGDLIKKAGKAIGSVVKSPIGQALGGVLRTVAKKALPIAGAALGNMVVPGVGGAIGGKLASAAGSMFGLELEGLSQEDREFEVAKQFVRLAGDATAQAVQAAQQGKNVQQAVKEAVTQAAQKYAPGLLQGGGNGALAHGARTHGRWIRQGNKIVILGA